jgi:hypothetical protein
MTSRPFEGCCIRFNNHKADGPPDYLGECRWDDPPGYGCDDPSPAERLPQAVAGEHETWAMTGGRWKG